MHDDSTPLGQLIRQRRYQLGLSLRDLEALSGIERSNLSKIERGARGSQLEPASLLALSRALRWPLADLYESAGYPVPQDLPSIRPYLRRAYSVSEDAATEIERYLAQHSPGFTPGASPDDGEDELPEDNEELKGGVL